MMKDKISKKNSLNLKLYFIEIALAGAIVLIASKIEKLSFIENISKWYRRGVVLLFIVLSAILFYFILKPFWKKVLQIQKRK
ncbi:MAG TPA: hypothetical protein PK103_04105 [Elusimicrobiales bacterium]|nr:hypothetical protein [Elusimicrobiales bacterium]HOL62536.1 hypothetical protein [Elusimicrobiales bacterium]HPO95359.1 hypothetical protein [Elusimicrobiales bacterium]